MSDSRHQAERTTGPAATEEVMQRLCAQLRAQGLADASERAAREARARAKAAARQRAADRRFERWLDRVRALAAHDAAIRTALLELEHATASANVFAYGCALLALRAAVRRHDRRRTAAGESATVQKEGDVK